MFPSAAIITGSHSLTGPLRNVARSAGSRAIPDVIVASWTSVTGGVPGARPWIRLISGKCFSTGSDSCSRPASTSCRSISAVKGFVIEPMR